MPTKLQRWLDLIAFLAGRRYPVSVEEIMDAIPGYAPRGSSTDWSEADETARASARRKFERDKDELRDLGIPLETVEYSINYGGEQAEGYRIRDRDFYLPYLRLIGERDGASHDDESDQGSEDAGAAASPEGPEPAIPEFRLSREEAAPALEGLRRLAALPDFPLRNDARSAFRKLAFDLDPDPIEDTPVVWTESGSAEQRQTLELLGSALLRRKRVDFRYRGMYRDAETERSAHPYGLLFQHGQAYLVARDVDREAMRVFRVGRMDEVEVHDRAPKTPDYEIPADFDLSDYAGREAWELGESEGEPTWAEVRFDFPLSLWAERNRLGEVVEELDGGGTVRRFSVRQPGPFLRWLLSLGTDIELLRPESLQTALREMAREVLKRYRDSGDDVEMTVEDGER